MTHGWILVQTKAGQPTTFLKMVAGQEILYPSTISPVRSGSMFGAWLVNEGNWAGRLGYYTVGFSHSVPVGRRVWAKTHGTHSANEPHKLKMLIRGVTSTKFVHLLMSLTVITFLSYKINYRSSDRPKKKFKDQIRHDYTRGAFMHFIH